jgi:hypothetical protein
MKGKLIPGLVFLSFGSRWVFKDMQAWGESVVAAGSVDHRLKQLNLKLVSAEGIEPSTY